MVAVESKLFFVTSILLIQICFFLSGCTEENSGKSSLFAVEPAFLGAISNQYPNFEKDIRKMKLTDNGRIEQIILEKNDPEIDLQRKIINSNYESVVISPLLSLQAETITNQRPDIKFILLTWATNELIIEKEDHSELAENIVEVMFTKTNAIERTGEIVAKYLSTNQGSYAAILHDGDKNTFNYVKSFREGFSKEKSTSFLLEKQLRQANDRIRMKRIIETLEAEKVIVVFIDVGSLTPDALKLLKHYEIHAVVTNWGNRIGFEDTILISIDNDPLIAISKGIKATGGERVIISSKVVWGLAIEPPLNSLQLIDEVRERPGQ